MSANPSSPVRISIVGLGRTGGLLGWSMHQNELKGREDKFRIVAVCDVIRSRADEVAGVYGARPYYDLGEMLRDPEIEMVDIATRSCDHCDHASMALAAGKHVFLEKPIGISVEEARRLKRVAAKSGRQLLVRHNRRFDPDFVHVKEIMASRVLGEVFEIKLRRHGYARRDDWQTIKRFGGGQLLNWGVHVIDQALLMLGAPVADQWCDLRRVVASGDAEDHVKLLLRGRNGRIIDIEISSGVAKAEPTFTVCGTRGTLVCDGKTIALKTLDPKCRLAPKRANAGTPGIKGAALSVEKLDWVEQTLDVQPHGPAGAAVIWDFVHATLRRKAAFPVTLDQAIEVMRVISVAKKGTAFG